MKTALALTLIRLLGLLPLGATARMGRLLGSMIWHLPSRRHSVIDANLRIAFPDGSELERQRLHREHLIEMARLVLESGAVWYWPEDRLCRHIRRVEGREHLERARAGDKGFLLVSGHLGNWEILNLWTSIEMPLVSLYKQPSDRRLDPVIRRSRERFGARLVASGSPAMRQILKQLRQGGGVGLMIDQQPKQGDGVFAPFFGRPALTMTLVHRLVRQTGCRVLLVHTHRLAEGRGWSIDIRPAPDDIADADPQESIRCLHEWLEAAIRACPAQYLWSYKRYSLQPAGAEPVYRSNR